VAIDAWLQASGWWIAIGCSFLLLGLCYRRAKQVSLADLISIVLAGGLVYNLPATIFIFYALSVPGLIGVLPDPFRSFQFFFFISGLGLLAFMARTLITAFKDVGRHIDKHVSPIE
jgi:hypothetical protein